MGYNPLYAGNVGGGSSRQTQTGGFTNGTGSTIAMGTPVSTNTAGNMVLLDVTNEVLVNAFIGITSIRVPANAEGLVVNAGRLEGVNLGFSVGDPVYAGVTPGSLTNIKPDLTVSGWNSGDFVIFLGCYVKNQFTSGLYDIQLMPTVVGQL